MENHPYPHLWKPSVSICVKRCCFCSHWISSMFEQYQRKWAGDNNSIIVRMQAMTHWTFGVRCLEVDYRSSKQQVGAY